MFNPAFSGDRVRGEVLLDCLLRFRGKIQERQAHKDAGLQTDHLNPGLDTLCEAGDFEENCTSSDNFGHRA